MLNSIQRNFLFIWICALLGIAIVLSLTFAGCSNNVEVPIEGKATGVLAGDSGSSKCVDSDNGITKEVSGSVTLDGEVKEDKCVGPFLIEYFCENGAIANKNIRCECSKGKCS